MSVYVKRERRRDNTGGIKSEGVFEKKDRVKET